MRFNSKPTGTETRARLALVGAVLLAAMGFIPVAGAMETALRDRKAGIMKLDQKRAYA